MPTARRVNPGISQDKLRKLQGLFRTHGLGNNPLTSAEQSVLANSALVIGRNPKGYKKREAKRLYICALVYAGPMPGKQANGLRTIARQNLKLTQAEIDACKQITNNYFNNKTPLAPVTEPPSTPHVAKPATAAVLPTKPETQTPAPAPVTTPASQVAPAPADKPAAAPAPAKPETQTPAPTTTPTPMASSSARILAGLEPQLPLKPAVPPPIVLPTAPNQLTGDRPLSKALMWAKLAVAVIVIMRMVKKWIQAKQVSKPKFADMDIDLKEIEELFTTVEPIYTSDEDLQETVDEPLTEISALIDFEAAAQQENQARINELLTGCHAVAIMERFNETYGTKYIKPFAQQQLQNLLEQYRDTDTPELLAIEILVTYVNAYCYFSTILPQEEANIFTDAEWHKLECLFGVFPEEEQEEQTDGFELLDGTEVDEAATLASSRRSAWKVISRLSDRGLDVDSWYNVSDRLSSLGTNQELDLGDWDEASVGSGCTEVDGPKDLDDWTPIEVSDDQQVPAP